MSEENVEVVTRAFEAYVSGDTEAALSAFDPAATFIFPRPGLGVFQGRKGVVEAMTKWTGTFEEWRLEVEEIRDARDCVFLVTRENGRGKGSGVEVEQSAYHVITLRNRKMIHWQGFSDRQHALEAAGLSE